MVSIALNKELLAGLDRFIEERDRPPHGRMTREEALATIVGDWLMGQGFVPMPDDPDRIATAMNAAEVPKA